MSYLDSASLLIIPSGYKEDKIFSQLPEDGSGDLTFTRASDGTRVNSDGLVERVPYNLLQQSNTFSNSVWNKSNTTVTSGQSGYDGLSNAWNLIPNTTNTNSHRMYIDYSSGGGVFTASIYAKANGYNFLKLNNYSASVVFDISSGTIVSESGSPIESHIESVGNGWHKISVTRDSLLGNLRTQIFVQIDAANTSFSGDGTSGVLIQDAQLNEGPTAKPYIATTNRQDVPRLDYSNGCPCLLLEPQRTNLLAYSEQFDNAYWTKTNLSINANAITSPDGTQNADKLTENTATTQHALRKDLTVIAGTHTVSVFVKGTARFISIYPQTATNAVAVYDLVNQLVTYTSGSDYVSSNIIAYGNDWFRLVLTCNTSANTFKLHFYLSDSSTSPAPIYTGDGTSGLYIWGAQLEQGSYATSYIPTTSAAVTRLADAAYKTGISSLIGQNEGTLFVDTVINGNNNPILMQIINNTNNYTQSIYIEFNKSTNTVKANVYDSGVRQAQFSTSVNIGERYKIALVYKVNDFAFYVNGTQIGVDNSGSVQSGLQDIFIGCLKGNLSAQDFNGNILNQAILFPTRLTNDELATLTTL